MAEINKENQVLKLNDGRNLGYAECGDLNGVPIFHFHGHPSSRLEIKLFDQNSKKFGVHIIGVDRPGIGLSDFKPEFTLLDWPDDIAELADHLGLEKFVVEGISGGGPFALACAYKIPELLRCCGVIASMGLRNWRKKGMMLSNRIGFFITRWLPFLIKRFVKFEKKIFEEKDSIENFTKDLPEPDRKMFEDPQLLDNFIEAVQEAYRSGLDGVVHEERLYAKSWGFKLEEISPKLPVYLWHGDMDVFVPNSFGHKFCELIPNCKGFFLPNEGHLSVCINHVNEIFETLSS